MSFFKVATLLSGAVASVAGMQCLDQSGRPIDWWVIMKMPDGEDHAYHDSDSTSSELRIQGSSFTGALNHTMTQIYQQNSSSTGWIMYNDEFPDGTTKSAAHAKGVLGLEPESGFWLIHSTPRFPAGQSQGYFEFPENEDTYGQSYLCLSISSSQYEGIGDGLMINHVSVYDSNLPGAINSPNMQGVIDNTIGRDGPKTMDLKTQGGNHFKVFFKSKAWNDDLWDHFIAPTLKTNMIVETWMRPRMDSDCSDDYTVVNAKDLKLGSTSYRETQDHSKWGVATEDSWICIGDINRMTSQRKRGGGAACQQNSALADAIRGIVVDHDEC
jgi:deoxyribonuclease-2